MASKSSSSDVSAPNYSSEALSDDDLIRGFTLALGLEVASHGPFLFTKIASGSSLISPKI